MATSESRRALTVRLTTGAAQEAINQAARCGLDVPHWLGQAIEAYLAEIRCQHQHGQRPADGHDTT